jgi:hypothetical protein
MIIRTKYIGPTNFRGSRVKASTVTGKTVTIPWDYALNIDGNHRAAASACIDAHGDPTLFDRDRYSCIWDEGGGAVFFPAEGREIFPV